MGPTRQSSRPASFRHHLLDRPAIRGGSRAPQWLSCALVLATLASAVPSLFVPDLLGGAEVIKGNLRGTALVMLVVALPLLVTAMTRTARNSVRWLVVWMGVVAYLTYQGVMMLFATPYNSLFLAYVALLGFGLWSIVALLADAQLPGFEARTDRRMPVRSVAAMVLALAGLNALAWLVRIVPTIGTEDPASVFDGSGLLTSPGWVQDLAFWIPAACVSAVWTWRRRPRGILLAGAVLVLFAIESLSVASDQWWGVRADDTQPDWASLTMVPVFLALAVLTAVPLAVYLRNLDRPRA